MVKPRTGPELARNLHLLVGRWLVPGTQTTGEEAVKQSKRRIREFVSFQSRAKIDYQGGQSPGCVSGGGVWHVVSSPERAGNERYTDGEITEFLHFCRLISRLLNKKLFLFSVVETETMRNKKK